MHRQLAILALATLPALAPAQEIDFAPLDFRAVIDSSCDTLPDTAEAAALGVALGNIAIKTALNLAGTLLSEAGKDRKEVRAAQAGGTLYAYTGEEWKPNARNCLRFWYGRVGHEVPAGVTYLPGVDGPLAGRWKSLGFVETPYVYGEMRLVFASDMNAIRLVPVRYFVRPVPDFQGFLRKAPTISVAVDLLPAGGTDAFATHALGLPSQVSNATMVRARALIGKSSGWFTRPNPPADEGEVEVGAVHYNARVVLTADLPGSKLAAALGGALTEEKQTLIDALKPQLSSEKAAARVNDTKAAFDAVLAVEQAQQEFDAAEPAKKAEFEIRLRRAKYLADVALDAAGLSRRYNVVSP